MKRRQAGFTLLELLVVVTVVAVLASLLVPAVLRALAWADRGVAASNLRQIGIAMRSFGADHQDTLPGPMWPGQIPVNDPAREGRLARELADYLNVPSSDNPELVPLFIPPAFKKAMGLEGLEEARTYVLNMDVAGANPWGNLANSGERPMSLSRMPSSAWAMSDADQLHPRVKSAPWRGNTPARPVHSPGRMAVTFGGSVVFLTEAELGNQ